MKRHAHLRFDNVEAARQTAGMSLFRKAGHLTEFRVVAMHVDVTDENRVQQMATKAKSLFGRIDYFVNTAGVGTSVPAVYYTLQSTRFKLEMQFSFLTMLCSIVWAVSS